MPPLWRRKGLRRLGKGLAKGGAKRARGAVCAALLGLGTVAAPAAAGAGVALTVQAYEAEVAAAQRTAVACGLSASACDAGGLPADGAVRKADGAVFQVNWRWLQDSLAAAKTASAANRIAEMRVVGQHLADLAAEAAGTAGAGDEAGFARARAAANAVLARGEFQADTGPSWLDRQIARLQDWLGRLFMGLGHVGERNPWLAPLIEWSSFLLAAGGLVYFIRRSLARQALRITLGENAALAQRDGLDATDWARLADEQAARGEWREAVHSVYWAAILALETRRAWRPNPTRTPREYLRLLRSGSEAQRALRLLTRSLEQVWYGHSEATEAEFRSAQASLSSIRAADLQRAGSEAGGVSGNASPVNAS